MKNAYYIDLDKKGKTLAILGRIKYAQLKIDSMQSVLNEEIKQNQTIINKLRSSINGS